MKELIVEMKNQSGLHARPATLFVETAKKFDSEITIEKEGKKVNAKSILGILSLAVQKGEKLCIKIIGKDEIDAMGEIKDLFDFRLANE